MRTDCKINLTTTMTIMMMTMLLAVPLTARAADYGSVAFGHTSSGYTWKFQYGRTESEARSRALANCRSRGGRNCDSYEFTRGQCVALAIGTSDLPAMGVAGRSIRGGDSGRAKLEAQNTAIAQCRRNQGTNCRIATGDSGHVASICLPSS